MPNDHSYDKISVVLVINHNILRQYIYDYMETCFVLERVVYGNTDITQYGSTVYIGMAMGGSAL